MTLIEDSGQPAIVRASAIARLARQPGPAQTDTLSRALNDHHALVREAAVSALAQADAAMRVRYLPRMLSDPSRTVRIAAARALADLPAREMPPEAGAPLAKALDEYIATQRYNADRPEAHVALGTLYAQRGDMDSAGAAFRTATELDPRFVPAYVNWADAHRASGREADAEQVLRAALEANPRNATLLHALGLNLVRQGQRAQGLRALGDAARLEPASARYAYVYGVGLHDAGQPRRAIQVLEAALERHPNDRDLLYALAGYQRDAGRLDRALVHARRLATLEPADASIRAFIAELERRR
jgi:Flp pilus assembly protein TadD